MSIPVVCPNCGQSYRLNERYAGQRVKCRACQHSIDVPVADAGMPLASPPTSRARRPSFAAGDDEERLAPTPAEKQSVALDCTRCRRRYRVPAELAHTSMKCRQCGEPLVPAPIEAAAPRGPASRPAPTAPSPPAHRPSPQAGLPAAAKSPAMAKLAAVTRIPPAAAPPLAEPLPVLEPIDDLPQGPFMAGSHPAARRAGPGPGRQSRHAPAKPQRKEPLAVPPDVWTWGTLAAVVLVLLAAVLTWISPLGAVFAFVFLGVGAIVATVAAVWLLCIAFMEDVVCGLLYLFVPFYSLYYVITRWDAAKVPFLSWLGGSGLLFGGFFVLVINIISHGKLGAPAGGGGPPPEWVAQQAIEPPLEGPAFQPASPWQPPAAGVETPAAADPKALFNLGNVDFPAFAERGQARSQWPGIDWFEIHLGLNPPSTPGHGGKLWLYLPQGQHAAKSLPCVMVAPAGSVLFTGMGLADGDRPEHLPYVQNGFAVLAYELDGALAVPNTTNDADYAQAYHAFRMSRAGLVNARVAIQYLLTKVPEVDPERIYAAGHSSAATHALLLAAHEPRIKGCAAFAAVVDVPTNLLPVTSNPGIQQIMPGIQHFAIQSSPHTHEARLNCPLFLFYAQDDNQPVVQGSSAMASRLQQQGKQVELVVAPSGGHHQSMIDVGIPKAIEWLKRLAPPPKQPGQ